MDRRTLPPRYTTAAIRHRLHNRVSVLHLLNRARRLSAEFLHPSSLCRPPALNGTPADPIPAALHKPAAASADFYAAPESRRIRETVSAAPYDCATPLSRL